MSCIYQNSTYLKYTITITLLIITLLKQLMILVKLSNFKIIINHHSYWALNDITAIIFFQSYFYKNVIKDSKNITSLYYGQIFFKFLVIKNITYS